ncbi:hypothetical protein OVA06_13160 [Pseudarthrobacter sp. SL88]|uniref:hypothetical protein n=1 Tax=Pseudarthrobacter sp. SL88 TaxID=2994666 RepID=UPI002272B48A|nr:hypothetical protein [Pseudarthrobacter sp. SL88]MCY1675645.1 hypothetical protein [Pseudarthrobacter sp. SL88]
MIRNATRRLAPPTLLAALMLIVPQAASAADPVFYPACPGFDVAVSGVRGNQDVKVTREKNGLVTTKAGGDGFILTLTSSKGTSITVPTNGSNTTTTKFPGGARKDVLTGQNVFLYFSGDNAGGTTSTPATVLYTGRVVITTSATGVSTLESASGKQQNLCNLL